MGLDPAPSETPPGRACERARHPAGQLLAFPGQVRGSQQWGSAGCSGERAAESGRVWAEPGGPGAGGRDGSLDQGGARWTPEVFGVQDTRGLVAESPKGDAQPENEPLDSFFFFPFNLYFLIQLFFWPPT